MWNNGYCVLTDFVFLENYQTIGRTCFNQLHKILRALLLTIFGIIMDNGVLCFKSLVVRLHVIKQAMNGCVRTTTRELT